MTSLGDLMTASHASCRDQYEVKIVNITSIVMVDKELQVFLITITISSVPQVDWTAWFPSPKNAELLVQGLLGQDGEDALSLW